MLGDLSNENERKRKLEKRGRREISVTQKDQNVGRRLNCRSPSILPRGGWYFTLRALRTRPDLSRPVHDLI